MAELAALRQHNAAAQEGNVRTRITLKLEPVGGDTFLAPKADLTSVGGIADQFRALGDQVVPQPTDPVTHTESVIVRPKNGAEQLRIVEKAGDGETVSVAGPGRPKANSDGCFVAGTIVLTPAGPRPIEQLVVG